MRQAIWIGAAAAIAVVWLAGCGREIRFGPSRAADTSTEPVSSLADQRDAAVDTPQPQTSPLELEENASTSTADPDQAVIPPGDESIGPADGQIGETAAGVPGVENASPAGDPPRASTPSRTDSPDYPVRLRAGVALPQTLPTGTAMGFSVDYQFLDGGPNPSAQYLWVIQPQQGAPQAQPVELESQGTLQAFALQWRPENGPFRCWIEAVMPGGSRRPVSPPVPMR